MAKPDLICTEDGCSKNRYARGYCNLHYQRFRAHGDASISLAPKPLAGEPLKFFKAAALSKTDECIIWPFTKNKAGYGQITIYGTRYLVHRAMLERVKGAPPTPSHLAAHEPVVCHNPSCINPSHLRWATQSENHLDKRRDGTAASGETHPFAKLSRSDVGRIRSMRQEGLPLASIARAFGVSESNVSMIASGKRWSSP